jgi:hypothetical protein
MLQALMFVKQILIMGVLGSYPGAQTFANAQKLTFFGVPVTQPEAPICKEFCTVVFEV